MSIQVFKKYLLSFFKKDWNIRNYPIQIYKNKNAGEKKVVYGAKIINWMGMVGHGETKEEALESLENHFNLYKDNNVELPRPGVLKPIEFAPTKKIDKYETFAIEFFKNVFGMNYYDGFYSDGSSLSIMELSLKEEIEEPREMIILRINNVYNVDISTVYDEPLWKIFQIISERTAIK